MTSKDVNLYYLKQGNKGFIKPIYSIDQKPYSLFNLQDMLINGKKVISMGKTLMFELSDKNIITKKSEESDDMDWSNPNKVGVDKLKLIELGSINSIGEIIISENFDVDTLENTSITMEYTKVKTKSLDSFTKPPKLPLEDLEVFCLTGAMKEALILAYLSELAKESGRYSLNMDSTFTKEYSFRILKVTSFEEVKNAILNNTLIPTANTVLESHILYSFQASNLEDEVFYSKDELTKHIVSLIKNLKNGIKANLESFEKGENNL